MAMAMGLSMLNGIRPVTFHCGNLHNRHLFYWLTIIFNRVDEDRVREVGPDRACAEWLLRNGASVRWKGCEDTLTDYNLLVANQASHYIEGVTAINAGISHIGFKHFEGCKHIKDVKLQECRYIDDKAMPLLSYLQDSLTDLQLIDCKSITEEGLYTLKCLKALKNLKVDGLPYVTNKSQVEKELKIALPECNINFV